MYQMILSIQRMNDKTDSNAKNKTSEKVIDSL